MSNILTPGGYKDISTLSIGDSVLAFDASGNQITNIIENIELIDDSTYSTTVADIVINDAYYVNENLLISINGEFDEAKYINIGDIIIIDGVEINVDNVFRDTENQIYCPDVLTYYIINDTIYICKYQSVYVNGNIVHAANLIVGDIIKDDNFNDVEIVSISATTLANWYKLTVSDNHSYILDNTLVHNASRFWVLGSGTWNTSSTTNWSSTSGGGGGSSVPTSADDVTFDSNSNATTYAVTFSGTLPCGSLTIGGPASGTLTVTNTSNTLQIFGNLFFAASGLTITNGGSATISLLATSGTKTITSNGVNPFSTLTLNGVGGTFQLVDDFLGGHNGGGLGNLNLTNGTFDPNGKAVYWYLQNNTNTLNGSWPFYDFFVVGNAISIFNVASNFSVANTLNISGANSKNFRAILQSSVIATPRVITCNGTVTGQSMDLQDITASGSATWNVSAVTGGSSDCGGNSGITFTSPTTCTVSGTAGFSWSSASWSPRFPLAQDTANINNSFNTGQTLTIDCPRVSSIIFSCTGNPTLSSSFSFGSSVSQFGSLDLTGIGNISSMLAHQLKGRGSYTIKSPINFKSGLTLEAPTGTYTFASNFITNSNITINNGTLNDSGYTITFPSFICSTTTAGITRALNMSGTWISTGSSATIWNVAAAANLNLTCTGLLQCSYTGATGTRTISNLMSVSTNPLNVSVTGGTDTFTIAANSTNYIKNLTSTGFNGTLNLSTANYSGDMTLGSTNNLGSSLYSLTFNGTGLQRITSSGLSLPWSPTINGSGCIFQLQDNTTMSASTTGTLTLTTGTLDLNNFNLTHNGIITTTGSNVRVFNIPSGSSYINVATTNSTIFNATGSNFAMSGTGIYKISGNTVNVRTFAGGGFTYPQLIYTNGTANGELDITGSNTFTGIQCVDTNIQIIKFAAGTTTTISSPSGWNINGAPGSNNIISGTGVFTLSCPYNNVTLNNVTISNSNARGGARWWANNSTNSGGNNGWRFGTPSNRQTNGNMLIF